MKPFTVHQGLVAPMDRANVDTDAMMPKQYLKCIFKTGYGDWAFDDWRYLDAGDVDVDPKSRRKNPAFELNQPQYQGASILLSRENFGCGSSREHAVWGLRDMGFSVIIASSFADIFYNNCFNNGILPVVLTEAQIETLFVLCQENETLDLTVDLVEKTVTLPAAETFSFDVEESRRFKLLNGLDNVAITLKQADNIKAFEAYHKVKHPYYFNRLS